MTQGRKWRGILGCTVHYGHFVTWIESILETHREYECKAHGDRPARESLEAALDRRFAWSQVTRSGSLLLLLASTLASTLVAAASAERPPGTDVDWKRGLDAIVAKLQADNVASASFQDVDMVTALIRGALTGHPLSFIISCPYHPRQSGI